MPETHNLAQLQAFFRQQLLVSQALDTGESKTPSTLDSASSIFIASPFTPAQLVNIYHNNFVMSLKYLLQQLFPITQPRFNS